MASLRQGVGTITAAALALALMIAVASYIYVNVSKPTTTPLDPLINRLDSYLSERLVLGPTPSGFYLVNSGNSPLSLDYIVLQNASSKAVTVVRASHNQLCSTSTVELYPGSTLLVTCYSNLIPLAVVTSNSRVFVRDPRLTAPYLIPKTIVQRVLLSPEVTTEVGRYLQTISNVVNTSTKISKYIEQGNVYVKINANASLVVATRAPGNLSLWNILIVGYGGYSSRPRSSMAIGNQLVNLSKVGYYRFRIKLENFTGTIKVDGVGGQRVLTKPEIVPNAVNWGKQYFLYLEGTAGRVSVYTNTSKLEPGSVDLDPYHIFGDLDDNGYPELIIVTQDYGTGDKSRVNDVFKVSNLNVNVVDSFLNPARVVFTAEPINNSKYATAIVSVRLFFWDSSEDDISDNDNRVILRVGIYDTQRNMYVYSVSMSYYELSRYRTVKPMTMSYVVKDFLLYIPSPDEIGLRDLYVTLEISDPYDLQGTRNDAEIIVGLEYVGLVLGVRP